MIDKIKCTSFTVLVIIPMALLCIYIGLIASDRYVSESRVTVKQASGTPDVGALAVSLLSAGGAGNAAQGDNLLLKDYVLSLDMLTYLDTNLGMRRAFQQQGDFLSRIWPWTSQEGFYKYYQNSIVEISIDDTSGVLVIRTQAYKADFSRKLNAAIMYQCEKYINDSSHKIADDQLRFVSVELARSNEDLVAARQKLLNFQNRNNMLDPVEKAKAMSAFVVSIESDIARQEADLKNLQTFLAEDSAQVVLLRNKLQTMKQQLALEKQKIAGDQSGKLNIIASQFMFLQFQADFALDKYKATLAAYEKTRVDASRKIKNLVVISSPHQQQEAEYPRRGYILLTALIGFLILYGIIKLLIATIEDHRD